MVSVIVPVYNAEKTLRECVDAVLCQTYRDFELILIDDGSRDRSGQICDEVEETLRSRGIPCTVIHQENGGVSRARNCGMDHARGEYFVCVDSDDVIEPCYLEDLVHAAQSHPDLGHVLCGFRCTSHVHDYILTDREPFSVADRRDYMRLFDAILVQGPCLALYRTEIVRSHGIRMREDLSLAEDILFNLAYLDALDRTGIGVVNRTNYIYQDEDGNSLYRKFRPDLLAINDMVIQSIARYMDSWGITDEASWQRFYNAALFKYMNALDNTFHRQNPMSVREKIRYNNKIMQSESFRDTLHNSTVRLIPAHRKAYESGDYRRVLWFEFVQKTKRRFSGLLRKQ